MIRTFELGGVVVPVHAAGDVEVAFEDIGGFTWPPLRMMNGAAIVQQHWRRLRVRAGGSGIVPAGLAGLDYTARHTLRSSATRAVQAAGSVIAVPAARRTDTGYAPRGYAVVDGRYYATPIDLVGDTATLTAVAGASGYGVIYFPELTVYARFSQGASAAGARHSWEIEAEEV